ncbi:MAG: YraN family protein [Burkholderiales bacterium]
MSRSIVKWVQGLRNPRAPDSPGRTRAERGAAGEAFAARFLETHKLRIVERNFRCRGGEIDLIADDGESLVFVEVRVRNRQDFGGARASIDIHKQRRILHAAHYYLAGKHARPCRFDVVLMTKADGAGIEWIQDAFQDE